LGCFAHNLGLGSAILAEFCATISDIEIPSAKGWNNLWLERDSKIVMLAFTSNFMVPWYKRNRWFSYLVRVRQMNFFVTHIFRGETFVPVSFGKRISLISLGLRLLETSWVTLNLLIFKIGFGLVPQSPFYILHLE